MTRASIERGVYSRRWIAGSGPATTSGLLFLERSQQAVDQGLRGTLIGHRLERFCPVGPPQRGGDPPGPFLRPPQALFLPLRPFSRGAPPAARGLPPPFVANPRRPRGRQA